MLTEIDVDAARAEVLQVAASPHARNLRVELRVRHPVDALHEVRKNVAFVERRELLRQDRGAQATERLPERCGVHLDVDAEVCCN